jgi:hypothetical protein
MENSIQPGSMITVTDGAGHSWTTVAEKYVDSWRPAVSRCSVCGGVYLNAKLAEGKVTT